jgi:hypothetical protein
MKQVFQSYRPILAALSSRRYTVALYAFVRCPTIILVVARAIAVPVIRDGEGGVLKHPRAVRQAQQVIVSGVRQIAISSVERLRLEDAPCRIPVALACPLARPALNPQSGADLVGIVENLLMLGEEMSEWDCPHPREKAKNHQNTWKICT